ncbi:MAG TPA: COX15/CtaA family protein [Candidatus Acidoferrales bacterium]|nr:COX15/CtaA family protein [Candidatus Acidoferrales bacterium]
MTAQPEHKAGERGSKFNLGTDAWAVTLALAFAALIALGFFCCTIPMPATYNPTVHRYAVFTACATVFLLVAGALVTSNDAGLAVPDWPTSYGTFFPPMVGGIFYEHGHRMVATFVGMATIGLALILWKLDGRPWMRRLGGVALAAVVVQGLFGGLTVKLRLPPAVSIVHATLAQGFFSIVVAIAVFTGRWWQSAIAPLEDSGSPRLSTLALWLACVTFVQLVLGAALRHNAFGIAPHIVGAVAVLALVIVAGRAVRRRFPNVRVLRSMAGLLNAVAGTQILLGLATWWSRVATHDAPQPQAVMIWLTVAHVVLGAVVLASTVVFALVCRRLLHPAVAADPAMVSGTERAAV